MFFLAPSDDGSDGAALSLGVVVGAMCTFRFVLPAVADAAGAVAPCEEEPPVQCSPEAVLAVVRRSDGGGAGDALQALREARAAAEAALAARAQPG